MVVVAHQWAEPVSYFAIKSLTRLELNEREFVTSLLLKNSNTRFTIGIFQISSRLRMIGKLRWWIPTGFTLRFSQNCASHSSIHPSLIWWQLPIIIQLIILSVTYIEEEHRAHTPKNSINSLMTMLSQPMLIKPYQELNDLMKRENTGC